MNTLHGSYTKGYLDTKTADHITQMVSIQCGNGDQAKAVIYTPHVKVHTSDTDIYTLTVQTWIKPYGVQPRICATAFNENITASIPVDRNGD